MWGKIFEGWGKGLKKVGKKIGDMITGIPGFIKNKILTLTLNDFKNFVKKI